MCSFSAPLPAPVAAQAPLLLSKLCVQYGDDVVDAFKAAKVQELLCYLLLHRIRPHSREALAALLRGDIPTAVSKKYLRQALWQLQASVRSGCGADDGAILVIESDWVRLNPAANLWIDVAELETAFSVTRGVPWASLDDATYRTVRITVGFYQGELLDRWYRDWCLPERERLQATYLALLDTLMGYCAVHRRFDEGLSYGSLSLRHDRARERTHQQLLRLHDLAGDRTAALRQYDRCVIALREDLGVEPADAIVAVYRQITTGQRAGVTPNASAASVPHGVGTPALLEVLSRLKQVQMTLTDLHRQVHQDMQAVEDILNQHAANGGSDTRPTVRLVAASPGPHRHPKHAVHR